MDNPKDKPDFNDMNFRTDADANKVIVVHAPTDPKYTMDIPIPIYMTEGCEELIPVKAHDDDAGYDLFASKDITIEPGGVELIHTGVHVGMSDVFEPNVGNLYGTVQRFNILADVRSKSGLALKKKCFVLNSPGTVDQSYRGEVCVIMANFSNQPVEFKRKDKVAQLVFMLTPRTRMTEVNKAAYDAIDATTDRGAGGFGSTGR